VSEVLSSLHAGHHVKLNGIGQADHNQEATGSVLR